jgi:hypothetical protein
MSTPSSSCQVLLFIVLLLTWLPGCQSDDAPDGDGASEGSSTELGDSHWVIDRHADGTLKGIGRRVGGEANGVWISRGSVSDVTDIDILRDGQRQGFHVRYVGDELCHIAAFTDDVQDGLELELFDGEFVLRKYEGGKVTGFKRLSEIEWDKP